MNIMMGLVYSRALVVDTTVGNFPHRFSNAVTKKLCFIYDEILAQTIFFYFFFQNMRNLVNTISVLLEFHTLKIRMIETSKTND